MFGVRVGAIEWRRQGSWHLTWRLSDRRGTIRSASACHPSRPLRNRAAGKGPVNCLQMCLDACFTDKHEAGAALWWYHWSLLICISQAESAATLQSGLVCVISDTRLNWLWPLMEYFDQSPPDSLHILVELSGSSATTVYVSVLRRVLLCKWHVLFLRKEALQYTRSSKHHCISHSCF